MDLSPLLLKLGIQLNSEFSILFTIGIIIITAALMGLIARVLKQPLILGYLFAGLILGPNCLGLVTSHEIIAAFAELGVAFLLFLVGLELDLSKLKECGKVALLAGIIEVLTVFSLGFFIATLFKFGLLSAVYMGMILSFSSTAILIQLLSNKRKLSTLHGRIILGILLVQDVLAVIALSILTTIGNFSIGALGSSLLIGVGLVALAIFLSQYLVPIIFKKIQKSPELMFLISIAVLFLFIGLTTKVGLSSAIGGFIAGISLSAFPYNVEIMSRAKSLKDFFVTIFFVSLGLIIDLSNFSAMILPFLAFLGVVMIFKPFIVTLIIHLQGYRRRTALLSGISLGQISEFSLVLALTGLSLGHISSQTFSLAALLLIVTVILTSYIIKFDNQIANKLSWLFYFSDSKKTRKESEIENIPKHISKHIVLFGAHEKGRKTIDYLKKKGMQIIAVDYDPEVVRRLKKRGIPCLYGDAMHPEILERLNLKKAELVISTLIDFDDNLFLVKTIKELNPDVLVFVSAEDLDSALRLYDKGADYVLCPKTVASEALLSAVVNAIHTKDRLERLKISQIRELEHKKEEDVLGTFGPTFLKDIKRRISEKSWRSNKNETDQKRR